jgi:putative multiple sugar transport system ATP-binding protein
MKPLLEMRSITKTFPGVKALNEVNLTVMEGEIHAWWAKTVRASPP